MSAYIRRFLQDPGDDVLLEIESINILDLDPPAAILGIGTGACGIIGEFENGPFNTPYEVAGADDLVRTFGSLGYTINGIDGNNPCARTRKADGAPLGETWNGNGFVQLSGKKFQRLIVTRVDTSVGNVTFNRAAFLVGAGGFSFPLTSGQILAIDIGAGPVSSTFTGAAATRTGVAGTYPTTFLGGETLTLGYDAATNFTVTFLAADQTAAQIAARINIYAGFSFADTNGGQLRLTGVQLGLGGQVRVVSSSAGSVLTQLGITVTNTAGTGNVQNIASVTPAEVKTIVEAAVAGSLVETQLDGKLRISKVFVATTDTITVGAATTAANLGFVVAATNANVTGAAGVIPAGTIVTNVGATVSFVTMQDVAVTAALGAGPYTVKVRHMTDDGTGVSATAATIVKIANPISIGSFTVANAALISACLSEAAIDAMYSAAMATTIDVNSIAREMSLMYSARQSNVVRRTLKATAIQASAEGCYGRLAFVRPPLNTPKVLAKSTTSEPGVGAYRDQRVVYNYPGANTFIPLVAKRGTSGGTGFTFDGNVDVGSDGFCASICSQLAPEENPGQSTAFAVNVNAVETGANAQGFNLSDYKQFKAAGICALRTVAGDGVFQSGCTSVDPGVFPQLVNISRRRMADYVEDTLARRGVGYGKKLSTFARRKALAGEFRMWLRGLLSVGRPENQRIAGFTVDTTANTQQSIGKGLFRVVVKVQTLSSLDSIVIAATIGSQVITEEIFPQAA